MGGTYTGTSSAGTLTLTVSGPTFADGRYSCSPSGCAFTGTVAGKHAARVMMSALSGVGQATSSVFSNRDAWVSAVSDWANASLGGDQVASTISAAASVHMPQTLIEPGEGSGHSGEGGGNGGMNGGGHGY